MKSIIFLETIEETNFFIKNFQKDKNLDILSFNPNIEKLLKLNNVNSISTANLTNKEFYISLLEKSENFKTILHDELNLINNHKLPQYYIDTILYYCLMAYRHFIWNIQVVEKLLNQNSYENVYGFVYKEIKTNSPWIEDDQLYLGKILGLYCKDLKLNFIPLKTKLKKVKRKSNNYFFILLKKLINFFLKKTFIFLIKSFTGNHVIFSNKQNKLNKVLFDLKNDNPNIKIISFSSDLGLKNSFKYFIKFFIKKNQVKDKSLDLIFPINLFLKKNNNEETLSKKKFLLDFSNIFKKFQNQFFFINKNNYNDILVSKFINDIILSMNMYDYDYDLIEKLLLKIKPKTFIAQSNNIENAAMNAIFKKNKIPTILISHGSHTLQNDIYSKIDNDIYAKNILVGDFDYLLAQTPVAGNYILQLKKDNNSLIKIKPILWGDKIKNKKLKNKNIITILHASTLKFRHIRSFNFETSDEYVKSLLQFIKYVKDYNNIRLIIKLRPTADYELTKNSLKYLLNPLPKNVEIISDKDMNEILPKIDLLTSFSSTTIEEALVNNIPVILYGGSGRYSHFEVKIFNDNDDIISPVVFINNHIDLNKYLKKLNEKSNLFSVPIEKFAPYNFNEENSFKFNNWYNSKFK